MLTYEELIEKIERGDEGQIELNYEDCCTIQKVLIDNGFACLLTGGLMCNRYCLSWIYAGDANDLNYADRKNIIFSEIDYWEMLKDITNSVEDGE